MMVKVYTAAVKAIPNLMSNMANPLLDQWSLGGIKNSETSQATTNAIIPPMTAKIENRMFITTTMNKLELNVFFLQYGLNLFSETSFISVVNSSDKPRKHQGEFVALETCLIGG